MVIIRSTHEILNNPWGEIRPSSIIPSQIPPGWSLERPITIDDIVMWEEIFYEAGLIGVYAAWSPFEDFYIITHNLHLKNLNLIEIFQGPESVKDLIKRVSELGITIVVRN